ncbi:Crp/Fnr family transcriptional regulator [Streptomyces sp. NPDC006638]|uniref:Crp/Fnr family transcriptional regulator n=1 Tax=unclassified Streptomyces TaxID=2593676 RepID=UPI00339FAC98
MSQTAQAIGQMKFTDRIVESLRPIQQTLPIVAIPRGSHIYNCTENDRSLYLVKSGQVKTVIVTSTGKRCLLDLYIAGEIFGELCMTRISRVETAVAMADTELIRIPYSKFFDMLNAGGLLEEFAEHLANRLSERQRVIVDLVTLESELRLAARLLQLSHRFGQTHQRGLKIGARLTQEELAEMVGTTRSRVGYFLKRFREAGLLESSNGWITIRNEANLAGYIEARLGLSGVVA